MNELEANSASVVVRRVSANDELLSDECTSRNNLICVSPDVYVLKKRVAYLKLFKSFFIAKVKNNSCGKTAIDARFLEAAFVDIITYVQSLYFGAAVKLLQEKSPDAFELILKKLSEKAVSAEDFRRIAELKTLRRLRPCVDSWFFAANRRPLRECRASC